MITYVTKIRHCNYLFPVFLCSNYFLFIKILLSFYFYLPHTSNQTINHIVSKWCRLAQKKYKGRHDWVGNIIQWELHKRLNFNPTTKWYMHKPESVIENETHKILWNFKIHMDHLIQARRSDLVLINKGKKKRICHLVVFTLPVDHRVKIKKREMINKYLDLAREQKKLWDMLVTVILIVVGALGTVPKGLERGLEQSEIRIRIETHTTTLLRSARISKRMLET